MNIESIEGIGESYGDKLRQAGVRTTEELLEKGRTPSGRKELAGSTGLSDKLVLKWVNMADLFRVKGVAGEYAELLEASGVDTVKELKHRNPANLASKMAEVNEAKKLTRSVPGESVVSGWIGQAQELPTGVEY